MLISLDGLVQCGNKAIEKPLFQAVLKRKLYTIVV